MEEEEWEERCQLFQDAEDDFDWRIGRRTETPGAGPQSDHSAGLFFFKVYLCRRICHFKKINTFASRKNKNTVNYCIKQKIVLLFYCPSSCILLISRWKTNDLLAKIPISRSVSLGKPLNPLVSSVCNYLFNSSSIKMPTI